ncbi:MAG TPA: class I SAM-dependent methyltransferase [Candidatus Paceibacterota bacterium]
MKCRACNTPHKPFFSLGKMPLVNSFLKDEKDFIHEQRHDLTVAFCPTCYLVQLTETISPETLFRDYIYFSSTSTSFLEHNRRAVEYLTERFHLTRESLVVEIASNDGAFLQFFKERGIPVLGIDPARNIADVANKKGIKTVPEFFNLVLAKKLLKGGVRADIVYGANVLAHVPDIVDFVRGVKTILKAGGSAIFEFPYIGGLMENKFDTIYHEHVFYYSLLALRNLFSKADLEVCDVEMLPVQGGSLRIYVSHAGVYPVSERVVSLALKERNSGFEKFETHQLLTNNIQKLKRKLVTLLESIRKDGGRIAAYGAPAKGNILLNYFGIGSHIEFIVDKAKEKQGLYTPGTHLRVLSPNAIVEKRPDYILILCWNIAEEVMNMQELALFRGGGGKYIIPIPNVTVL